MQISDLAAARGLAERYVINDLNKPLVDLWRAILASPEKLARQYETLWRTRGALKPLFLSSWRGIRRNQAHLLGHL
ncbi:MAG: hypothetical protein HZA90_21920 [Verrucomicrobia bacterium]|nr:hypothetical protein [Verrucomicrobiota bacterium]